MVETFERARSKTLLPMHPGAIDITSGANYEEQRNRRSFEWFLPFIFCDGLDKHTAERFHIFLQRLFVKTKRLWEPGQCTFADKMRSSAQELLEGSNFPSGTKVETRRYLRSHYWVVMTLGENGKELIIDSAGVPQGQNVLARERRILPFFGPVDAVTECFPKKVYTQGQPLDGWGTRNLPPGFHP